MIRPFPKPQYNSNQQIERLHREKAVTLALGFNCEGGIVMCADQQITSKDWHKYNESKMYVISGFDKDAENVHTAMLTYAGDPHVAKAVHQKLGASQVGFDSLDSLKSLLEGLLLELSRDDAESTNFLCGFCKKPGITGLLRTKGYSVHEVVNDRIGIGDSSLLRFLDKLLIGHRPLRVWEAVFIGNYIIKQAKEFVDGVGGNTDTYILRGNGKCAPPDDILIQKSSEAAEAIEHDIRSLLWLIGDGEIVRCNGFWNDLRAQTEIFINPARALPDNSQTFPLHFIPQSQWIGQEPFIAQQKEMMIPKFSMRFVKVSADPAFGNKPIIECDGEHVYPELAVVRVLKNNGFDAAWVDSYRGKFWDGMAVERQLPDAARKTYDDIVRANGGKRGGFWDVMAWKESQFFFVELKQNTAECKDRISEKQRLWLQSALKAGFAESCFFVCEWSYSDDVTRDH